MSERTVFPGECDPIAAWSAASASLLPALGEPSARLAWCGLDLPASRMAAAGRELLMRLISEFGPMQDHEARVGGAGFGTAGIDEPDSRSAPDPGPGKWEPPSESELSDRCLRLCSGTSGRLFAVLPGEGAGGALARERLEWERQGVRDSLALWSGKTGSRPGAR